MKFWCSVAVSFSSQHPGRPLWSSPSTSEDESAGSTAGDFSAPLLQRNAGGRRLLRSNTTSISSPTHTHSSHGSQHGSQQSSHHRNRRTNSNHFSGSMLDEGSVGSNSDMVRQSAHGMRPPLGQMQDLSEGDDGVACGADCDVEVVGLLLLHPSVAGQVGPSFTRLLGRTRYTFSWAATVYWAQTAPSDVLVLVLISSGSIAVHAGWPCILCRCGPHCTVLDMTDAQPVPSISVSCCVSFRAVVNVCFTSHQHHLRQETCPLDPPISLSSL